MLRAAVAPLLLLLLLQQTTWTSAQVDNQFIQKPKDGDSCTTYELSYRLSSPNTLGFLLNRFFSSFKIFSRCEQDKVVDSDGQCVSLSETDRCIPKSLFTSTMIEERCANDPRAVFADPYSCANYIDCSLSTTSRSCPLGLLYDDVNKTCRPFTDVQCGDRAGLSTSTMIEGRCASSSRAVFADPDSCANYIDCSLSTTSRSCPSGLLFDDVTKTCRSFTDVQCGDRAVSYSYEQLDEICKANPGLILGMSDSCNGYFNCSMTEDPEGLFRPYHSECSYLQLFDVKRKACLPYAEVNCANRPESKDPCSLSQFRCGRSSHCIPCNIQHPDCTNLPDGTQPFPGLLYTPKFARCLQGRSLGAGTCDQDSVVVARVFDARKGECTPLTSIPRSLGGLGDEDVDDDDDGDGDE